MRDARLHVVIGVKDEGVVIELSNILNKSGYTNPLVVRRSLKLSVMQYIEENRDVDVLILQEGLESSNFFQIGEYAKFLDINNKLIIIPILTDETMQNKQFLLDLYNNNLLTATFGKVSLLEIVQLIKNGRTRIAARQYYGISSLVAESECNTDYDSCVQYICFVENGSLAERLAYIKKRVTGNDFRIILKRLPMEILVEASKLSEYAELIEEVCPNLSDKGDYSLRNRFRGKLNVGNIASAVQSENEKKYTSFNSPVLIDYMTAVKKVVFGFAGAQEHIGATFNTITFAQYLAEKGYKVAVVEDSLQKNLSLKELGKNNDSVKTDYGFVYKKVAYYPNFQLQNLAGMLLVEDYNFVLIDFGIFREEILPEFNRCILPIIVAGSKIWEIPFLTRIFECVTDEKTLASYCYLFSFAIPSVTKSIVKNMGKLRNIFFAEYIIDPLSGAGYPAIEKMLGSYLPVEVFVQEKGASVFQKMKKLFE